MVGDVMLYAMATSALLAIGALAAEQVVRPYRLPGRWVWLAALVGSIALPAASWLSGGAWPGGLLFDGRRTAPVLDWLDGAAVVEVAHASLDAAARPSPAEPNLAGLLLSVWVMASLLAALGYGWTWWRLRRDRRRWRAAEVAGKPVLLAPRVGPVVIGLRRPAIVVPEWLLGEPVRAQRLVLLHEREHLNARDHVLLALAPFAGLVAPWNLPIWWMLRRLRLAIELDCDRRVLARGIGALAYGSVLLEVAGRSTAPSFAAALAEPRTFLERRILAMTSVIPARRLPRALAFGAVTAVVAVLACETAGPTNIEDVEPRAEAVMVEAAARPIIMLDGVVAGTEALASLHPSRVETIEIIGTSVERLDAEQRPILERLAAAPGVITRNAPHLATAHARAVERMRHLEKLEELQPAIRARIERLHAALAKDGKHFVAETDKMKAAHRETIHADHEKLAEQAHHIEMILVFADGRLVAPGEVASLKPVRVTADEIEMLKLDDRRTAQVIERLKARHAELKSQLRERVEVMKAHAARLQSGLLEHGVIRITTRNPK